jgi:hypothetical protein
MASGCSASQIVGLVGPFSSMRVRAPTRSEAWFIEDNDSSGNVSKVISAPGSVDVITARTARVWCRFPRLTPDTRSVASPSVAATAPLTEMTLSSSCSNNSTGRRTDVVWVPRE